MHQAPAASDNAAAGTAPSVETPPARVDAQAPAPPKDASLRERALADANVRALLEVFPAEIRDVEEM